MIAPHKHCRCCGVSLPLWANYCGACGVPVVPARGKRVPSALTPAAGHARLFPLVARIRSLRVPGVEEEGIERIPETARQATPLRHTIWLWWSANTALTTVAVGTLGVLFQLGIWWSAGIIVLGTLLGALPVAYLSTWGPKTGLAQMPLSRFAFGFRGAKLTALCNALACLGWNALGTVMGAQLITIWSDGALPAWLAMVLLTLVVTLVALYGYFLIHRTLGMAWAPMGLLLVFVAVGAASHVPLRLPVMTQPGLLAGAATFAGAVLAHTLCWSSLAADFTRYQPATTSASRIFWAVLVGLVVPCILLELLGVALASGTNDVQGDVGRLLVHALPSSQLPSLVVLLLALSIIPTNVPAGYSLGLSLQVLGFPLRRWQATLAGGLLTLSLALMVAGQFQQAMEGFLLLMASWVGAWCAIVLIEHGMRRGYYPLDAVNAPDLLPRGQAALLAWGIGCLAATLGAHQPFFEGPVSAIAGGADLGFPLAALAAGVSYYLLRRSAQQHHSFSSRQSSSAVEQVWK